MVRILAVIRYPIGGIRTYLKYMYGNLDKRKYSFVILTVPNDETKIIKEDLRDFIIEIIEVKGRSFLLSFGYQIFVTLLKKKIDIIHSQGASSGILASVINVLFRVPHIVTLHETFEENMVKGKISILKRKMISYLFSKATFLNTVSDDAKINLVSMFPELKKSMGKIVVIKNGVDTSYFSEPHSNHKCIYDIDGIRKDAFVIGYLGRYMPEKGFLVLVDAINILSKENKEIKVLALGWGAFIREYQAYIREKGLTEYFVFIEFQSDVRWILRQINLLAIPSLREAFGLVAVEGLVSGTPIIASNCIGLREVLKDTPARTFETGNSNDLASAILKIMKISPKTDSLNFISTAKERFDIKSSVKKLELLFENAEKNGNYQSDICKR